MVCTFDDNVFLEFPDTFLIRVPKVPATSDKAPNTEQAKNKDIRHLQLQDTLKITKENNEYQRTVPRGHSGSDGERKGLCARP